MTLTTPEDKAVAGQVVATDVDGDTLGYTVGTGPAHGALALDAATGAYTYTPGADFNGADSFKVQVSDGNGGVATQTVNVVTPVTMPVTTAATVTLTTPDDKAVAGQVVATDVDARYLGYTVGTGPAHGALALAYGRYTYTPGADFQWRRQLQGPGFADGNGGVTTQTVNVGVTPAAPVNDTSC